MHDFDAVRWVTGREVVEVYATGEPTPRRPTSSPRPATSTPPPAILTLDDGTLAIVSNSRYNGRGYDVRLEVHGATDSVAAGLDDGLPLRSTAAGVTFPAGPPHTFFMDRLTAAFRAELRGVRRGRRRHTAGPVHGRRRPRGHWIAEAATRSRATGRPQRLAEIRAYGSV